jgi:hypothetical protein
MSLKTKMTLSKQNSGRLHNIIGIATRAMQSLKLLIENSSPSSPSEHQVCTARGNSKVEYTYGWY